MANATKKIITLAVAGGLAWGLWQVGGMLWSEGSTDNFAQLAGLLNSGYDAAKAVSSSTVVALHLAKGGDLTGTRWWFDTALANGVKFDAIGLSYYGYWHGSLHDFQTTLDDAASRYAKPVFVADFETAVSANPYIQFKFRATESGAVVLTWTDDDGSTIVGEETITVS